MSLKIKAVIGLTLLATVAMMAIGSPAKKSAYGSAFGVGVAEALTAVSDGGCGGSLKCITDTGGAHCVLRPGGGGCGIKFIGGVARCVVKICAVIDPE